MKFFIIILILFIYSKDFGQTSQYQTLLDSALPGHGALFVHSKPIAKIMLDEKDIQEYFYLFRNYTKKVLDTIILAQIIRNSKSPDTTLWKESELQKFLLVQNRDETVFKKYAIKKFTLTDKKEIKFYNKQINKYNSTDNYNKNIYYFSRPIFDDTKKFAIVEWNNPHSGLGGGGAINLYQFKNDSWENLGRITFWNY